MNNFDYRYMIYNTRAKEFQFMRICETTEKKAQKMLRNLIGKDSLKWRFEIKKVKKDEAEKIKKATKLKKEIESIKSHLTNFSTLEIENLINENKKRYSHGKNIL